MSLIKIQTKGEQHMKKTIIAILLTFVCIATITTGCGEQTKKKPETKQETKKTGAKQDKDKAQKESMIKDGKIFYANQAGVTVLEKAEETSKVLWTIGLNDEVMTIGEASGGFYKVTVNGSQGYVATKYLASEKVTQSAEVTPAPTTPTTPVTPTTPSGTQGSTTTKPSTSTTTTTKPSSTTTTTKPSTTPTPPTTKPSTPAPTPAPTPTPEPEPVFTPTAHVCPYTMMVDTTYNGYDGFFYTLKFGNPASLSTKQAESIMAKSQFDETGHMLKQADGKEFYVGYYDDLGQVYFFYVTP